MTPKLVTYCCTRLDAVASSSALVSSIGSLYTCVNVQNAITTGELLLYARFAWLCVHHIATIGRTDRPTDRFTPHHMFRMFVCWAHIYVCVRNGACASDRLILHIVVYTYMWLAIDAIAKECFISAPQTRAMRLALSFHSLRFCINTYSADMACIR